MSRISLILSAAALLGTATGAVAQDAVDEYDTVLRRTESLVAYNALLERQITTQTRQIGELQVAIEQVPELERQIPPLIERMVDGLEQFVELDLPFQENERADRVANMRNLVETAAVSDAEKFRRVLEAWEIENEFGRTVASYRGQIELGGVSREVDFLQIGRIALLYQTTDQQQVGAWDPAQQAFAPLGTEHRNSIRQAIRMANSTVAPDLALLPVPAPSD